LDAIPFNRFKRFVGFDRHFVLNTTLVYISLAGRTSNL